MTFRHRPETPIIRPLALLGIFLAISAVSALAQDTRAVACVSCLVLDVPLDAVPSLAGGPGSLEGLTVAVRWPADTQDTSDSRLNAALDRLTAAGARAGIVIAVEQHSDRPPTDSLTQVAGRPRFALVDPPPGADLAARIFAVRSLITALRAVRPDVEIAIEPDDFRRTGLPLEAIQPYVDTLLSRVVLPLNATVDDLIEASQSPTGERVRAVIDAPDWNAVADFVSRRALSVDVTASRQLTAGEIVARHQARRRQQDSLVKATIGHGTTTVMFEVPGFVAPVTITARTTIYARGDTVDVEHQDVRVNGAAIAVDSETPRLPLIEPERITTPPLQISLTDAYSYKLDGVTTIDGAAVYVIGFAPHAESRGLAHGRAWIDATDFRLRRLQVTQAELRGPIVSSDQVQDYTTIAAGGQEIDLPGRTRIYQMYEGAGHRTPIHRAIDVEQYAVNPPEFDELLQAARASSHLIVRETPAGLYVAGNRGTTIRTAVLGVLVDPNISNPLPFAGISYVDLDVLGTGAQLNGFFGGTYGQLSWSVPSPGGSRWQIHGRAFAIAARYNDRSFRGGFEQYVENILQRPAHVSAGVVRPLTPRLRARIDYELDVTAFSAANTTSAAFRVPTTAIVHGLVTSVEGEREAWAARAWWNPARRQGWREWGAQGEFDRRARDFQRYGASLSRTLALSPALGSRLEAVWTGGHDLDRFSRYIVNSFDNRVHGYPTASIRYDGGLVARSATSWTRRGWRLDGFADLALVRDPGFGEALRGYPGVGAALESAGPFRTLLSFEWGYGFKAVARDGGRGTQALRISAYRMF